MFKKIKSFFGLDRKTGEQENEAMSQLSTIEQLKKLGYMYNEKGILVKVDAPDKGFTFEGQAHYEKLGDVVADEIQRRIRDVYHLEEHWLPCDDEAERPRGCKCNVFTTPDILTSEAPLAVFICGSGAVVAGQWARSLCINNSLDEGSSLPEIEMALKNGWSVLVTNNNMPMGTKKNDNSNERALCAWKRFVRPSHARTIAVLAHSYGGINTCYIIDDELRSGSTSVLDKIACIAFTDSVHYPPNGASEEWFRNLGHKRVRNWVQSDDPLDTKEDSYDCINCVSAGHRKHEFTTCSARKSVHKFMIENVEKYLHKADEEKSEPEKEIEKKGDDEVKKEEDEEKTEEKKEEEGKEEKTEEKKDEENKTDNGTVINDDDGDIDMK